MTEEYAGQTKDLQNGIGLIATEFSRNIPVSSSGTQSEKETHATQYPQLLALKTCPGGRNCHLHGKLLGAQRASTVLH